jgi:hypothetical protein
MGTDRKSRHSGRVATPRPSECDIRRPAFTCVCVGSFNMPVQAAGCIAVLGKRGGAAYHDSEDYFEHV